MPSQPVPSVSVVMPAYNAAKYLREAIESILRQTYTDFEFIIINDGSTDDTRAIIQSYDDPRIVYLENETNSGICVTLNKGLDSARGRYIARMDADDISLPERLAVQVAFMDAHPEVGVAGSDIVVFGEDFAPYTFKQLHTPEDCMAGLLFNTCFSHSAVMIRKSVISEHNLRYNDVFRGLEDYELWWQISKYSKLNNIDIPLLRYRHHKGQETQNVTSGVKNAFKTFTKCRFDDLGIMLSDAELALWNAYSTGRFYSFDDKAIKSFIILARKILSLYPLKSPRDSRALNLTLSKAITFLLGKSHNYTKSRQYYYNQSLSAGVFPLMWYIKVTGRNILQ